MVETATSERSAEVLGDDVITPHLRAGMLPKRITWACSGRNLCAHSHLQPTCHRATFQVTAQRELYSRAHERSQSSTCFGQKHRHSLSR